MGFGVSQLLFSPVLISHLFLSFFFSFGVIWKCVFAEVSQEHANSIFRVEVGVASKFSVYIYAGGLSDRREEEGFLIFFQF